MSRTARSSPISSWPAASTGGTCADCASRSTPCEKIRALTQPVHPRPGELGQAGRAPAFVGAGLAGGQGEVMQLGVALAGEQPASRDPAARPAGSARRVALRPVTPADSMPAWRILRPSTGRPVSWPPLTPLAWERSRRRLQSRPPAYLPPARRWRFCSGDQWLGRIVPSLDACGSRCRTPPT